MKKTTLVKIFVLLALSLTLIGCGKGKDTPTDVPENVDPVKEEVTEEATFEISDDVTSYFKKTSGDENLVEGTYDVDESGQYYFYVDNYSTDKYALLDLIVDEIDSENEIYNLTDIFIRPGYYFVDFIDAMPGLYYTPNLEFYTLQGPVDFSYDYNYGYDSNDNYITNIAKSGGFTEDELELVAIQEYIIAAATGMYETEYFYYDQVYDTEKGYDQFDPSTAIYKTVVDYDAQSISLYSLKDGLKELQTIDMPFGW